MTTRLVLCGSGEFTPAMDAIDRDLLADLGPHPRVAIVPTAAGLEETPKMWAQMGSDHFRALGAEPVPVMVTTRADAEDARFCDLIAGAGWIYFSGGNPGYLVETVTGTPFWTAVHARFRAGAILAGSSAGAMMLGATTFVPRKRGPDGIPTEVTTRAAMGILPGVIVAPHFDILPAALRTVWSRVVPAETRLIGIDEDTALIARDATWTVRGRGRVHVFGDGEPVTVASGATLDGLLPAPLAYTQ
ncbi:MAG TPA: Type 1 glutamine amidotransferase-like domain-containing protein [Candidatus Limnocylindria bacterium]